MNNRIAVLAIGLGLILTGIVPVILPHFVLARGCTDARGNPVACPSQPEDPETKRKTPTPVRSTKTPNATLTSTPQAVSPTPTLIAAALPMIAKGDELSPHATDTPGGWPLSVGSITHQMQGDGDSINHFFGDSRGWLGILGLTALVFILVRAARINYGKFDDDTGFFFRKRKPKGGSMPLETELGFPDTDESSKDAAHMKINFRNGEDPGYRVPYKLTVASPHDENQSVIVEPPHTNTRHTKDDDDA